MFTQNMSLEAGFYRKFHEFHFSLPRIDKRVAIGIFVTALIATLALTACVSPEQLQTNTILQCRIPSIIYEGRDLNDEGRPYYPILALGDPVFVNPFVVTQGGQEFLVGYYYDPPLQFHVRNNKASLPKDCQIKKGSLRGGQYDPERGYTFRTDSGEDLQVGYLDIEKRGKK